MHYLCFFKLLLLFTGTSKWLQAVKCILPLHLPTMLLLQRKFLTSQILLACSQGNKARCFLNWGKRKRTLDRVQWWLQIGCQAVRLCYGCYFTLYLPLPCAIPLSFAMLLKSYLPFFPGLLANFCPYCLVLLYLCYEHVFQAFLFLICIFACQSCDHSYHQIVLNETM